MSDLIDRQAAIDAVESAKTARTPDGEIYVAKLNAEMNIQILPSAQPERKTGLVDRKEVIKAFTEMDHMGLGERDIIHEFETMPSVDAVPVVRCKDCKHFHYDMPYVIQGIPVLGHDVCDFWGDGCKTNENGFCSYAERRTDG